MLEKLWPMVTRHDFRGDRVPAKAANVPHVEHLPNGVKKPFGVIENNY
jgi:hypothetical protein